MAVRNDLQYAVVRTTSGRVLIIQAERLEPLQEKLGSLDVISRLTGRIVLPQAFILTDGR